MQAVWLEDRFLMIGKTLGHYQIMEKLAKAGWAWSTKPATRTSTASPP